jgi:hypothetical protein
MIWPMLEPPRWGRCRLGRWRLCRKKSGGEESARKESLCDRQTMQPVRLRSEATMPDRMVHGICFLGGWEPSDGSLMLRPTY